MANYDGNVSLFVLFQQETGKEDVTEGCARVDVSMLYRKEQQLAECVRFCWCRPMGWMAKSQLAKVPEIEAFTLAMI